MGLLDTKEYIGSATAGKKKNSQNPRQVLKFTPRKPFEEPLKCILMDIYYLLRMNVDLRLMVTMVLALTAYSSLTFSY